MGFASSPLRMLRVIARLNVGGPARHVVILDTGLRTRGKRARARNPAVQRANTIPEAFAPSNGPAARSMRVHAPTERNVRSTAPW
jgi:hypothetical protein